MPFTLTSVVVCIVIGLLVGLIGTSILKSSLISVDFMQEANSYRDKVSLTVSDRKDVFLYKKLDKTPIPKKKDD